MFCWPRITEKQGEVRPAPSNVVFKNSEVNYALPGVAYRLNGALGHFWEDVRPSYAFAGALDYNNLSWLNKKILKSKGTPEGDFRDWKAIRTWAEESAFTKSTQ